MRSRLFRLSLSALVLAFTAGPAAAFSPGCPTLVKGGTVACHSNYGSCENCHYICEDGTSYTFNMCGPY